MEEPKATPRLLMLGGATRDVGAAQTVEEMADGINEFFAENELVGCVPLPRKLLASELKKVVLKSLKDTRRGSQGFDVTVCAVPVTSDDGEERYYVLESAPRPPTVRRALGTVPPAAPQPVPPPQPSPALLAGILGAVAPGAPAPPADAPVHATGEAGRTAPAPAAASRAAAVFHGLADDVAAAAVPATPLSSLLQRSPLDILDSAFCGLRMSQPGALHQQSVHSGDHDWISSTTPGGWSVLGSDMRHLSRLSIGKENGFAPDQLLVGAQASAKKLQAHRVAVLAAEASVAESGSAAAAHSAAAASAASTCAALVAQLEDKKKLGAVEQFRGVAAAQAAAEVAALTSLVAAHKAATDAALAEADAARAAEAAALQSLQEAKAACREQARIAKSELEEMESVTRDLQEQLLAVEQSKQAQQSAASAALASVQAQTDFRSQLTTACNVLAAVLAKVPAA